MKYMVEIVAKTRYGVEQKMLWVKGGIGYTDEEMKSILMKIKNDSRVVSYEVIEMKRRKEVTM